MKPVHLSRWSVRLLAGGLAASSVLLGALPSQARDPWLQPFSSESIWNMPIGQSATYVYANVGAANFIDFDTEYAIKTASSDPIRDLLQANSWGDRDSGTLWKGKWHLPDSFVLADADFQNQPNNCSAFLDPDGRTLRQLNATARPTAGGNLWGYVYDNQNLYKKGLYGGHGGTGLSSIGGTIRKGELTSTNEIKHALKLTMHEKYFSFTGSTPGYRWPAYMTDGGANSSWYTGQTAAMTMGSLVAINPNQSESSLGLETAAAKKVFRALRDYGAYVVDSSGWDAFYLNTEVGVSGELQSQLGYNPVGSNDTAWKRDMNRLVTNLSVIDDNGPNNIGGAGTRRAAKADPLPTMPSPAGAMSRSSWAVWGSASNPANMIDGNATTSSVTTGNQDGADEWITIDFGAPVSFNRILLETAVGSDENRYPRAYSIYTSSTGSFGDFLTSGYGESRLEGETEIFFGDLKTTRYLTIQQTGSGDAPWSIAEINVFNTLTTAAATPTPTPAASGAPIGSTISIWAGNASKFVTANLNNAAAGNPLVATAGSVNAWERLRIDDAGGGYIALWSPSAERYVSVDNNQSRKPLIASWATGIGDWEKFTWSGLGSNKFALKSKVTNKYVSCDTGDGAALVASWADNPGSWEEFYYDKQCLTGTYFDNIDFTGTSKVRRDETINFNWGTAAPISGISPNTYSVRWTGFVVPKYSQAYTFYVKADDGVRLWINGTQVINKWVNGNAEYAATPITLVKGQKYSVKLEYYQNTGNAACQWSWASTSQLKQIVPDDATLPQ